MRTRLVQGLSRFAATLAALVLTGAVLVGGATPAFAADKIYLKDGRVIEGEIVREHDGSVWVNYKIGGVEQNGVFFSSSMIDRIERDAPAEAAPIEAKPAPESAAKAQPRRPGVPRAVVLTLEGTVGLEFAAKPLKDAIPMLEAQLGPAEDGERVVVLKVNSGGGLLLEIEHLHKVLEEEYKPRFRTVAWIESAISAAAMTSHILEEIYFMPQGNYGACTGYSGPLVAMKDRPLEEVLYMMEKVSAKGNHPIPIMRSMQIDEPLSANIGGDGQVSWYNTDEGEFLVNPKGRILTFNANTATKFKFSKGTAATVDELAKLLGYQEVEWVGRPEAGSLFPISKAEEHQRWWRESVEETTSRFNEYFAKYQISVQNAASSQDRAERGMFVGAARRELAIIERACKEHPNIKLLNGIPDGWFEEQHELLRDLMRQ
ncbi:MAG TPA: hypothetical protein VFF69_11930 [Phycisphaerales bacterium]|nr:hypothetical protein [Phycisphaerales bacterium]